MLFSLRSISNQFIHLATACVSIAIELNLFTGNNTDLLVLFKHNVCVR